MTCFLSMGGFPGKRKGRGVESISWKGRRGETWDLRADFLNTWVSGHEREHSSASLESIRLWPRGLGLKIRHIWTSAFTSQCNPHSLLHFFLPWLFPLVPFLPPPPWNQEVPLHSWGYSLERFEKWGLPLLESNTHSFCLPYLARYQAQCQAG